MKNAIKLLVTGIICVFIGCGLMYALIYFYPNTIVKSVTKQEVTVSDTGISKSVEKVYDSVVYISTESASGSSIGTGFVYKKTDKYAYILTNYHVVSSSKELTVEFSDDKEISAKNIGGDKYADIAVLIVDAKDVKAVAVTGKSANTKVGDTVFAVGAPMGLGYKGTVTKGILSGKDRMVAVSLSGNSSNDWAMNVMQTDAAISPGNSGGPLCNINGEVIGVNSMKIVKNEVEGLGFSIPVEDALTYASKIEKGESTKRPYIGVELISIDDIANYKELNLDKSIKCGVLIGSVEKDSPGEKSGLKTKDVIIKIGDKKIENMAEFRYYLYKYQPGDKVKITVNRSGKEKVVEVKLKELEN